MQGLLKIVIPSTALLQTN